MKTLQSGKECSPFDFIHFCKDSKIQISAIDYLKSHPNELKIFIKHCKDENVELNHATTFELEDDTLTSNLFNEVENSILATSPGQKLEPFYVSLFINGWKLSNCIIDSGASDNVMPYIVAKALGLTLTKSNGRCYAMDAKQVILVGQIKDIPISYGLLLSRSFCKDLGKEIKLDWSQAMIPIGNKRVKLEPEEKSKFTVQKLDNPKAQVLYQELEFGNYMLYIENDVVENELEKLESKNSEKDTQIWTLEFDGSCSSSGSSTGIVLIPPDGEPEPLAFKSKFGNTNNFAEYEALLLGIIAAKERGVKVLKARGDGELNVWQVKGQYSIKNHKLKNYRNRVWGEIEGLETFSIESVPREMNMRVDSLVVSVSLLLPHLDFKEKKYQIEVICRLSIPDNIKDWQVFTDDKSLQMFLENVEGLNEEDGSDYQNDPIGKEK